MIFDVKTGKASRLVNAYTGEPMKVKLYVGPGGDPMLFAPDEFTPSAYFDEPGRIAGYATCLYTGEPLALERDDNGWRCEGGFDPRMMRPVDEFLRLASMRNGESPYPEAGERTRVLPVEEAPPPPVEEDVERTDDALRVAEATVAAHKDAVGLKESSTVSMHVPSKKKGRR